MAKQDTGHTREYVFHRVVRRGEYFTSRGLQVFANKPEHVVRLWIREWLAQHWIQRLTPVRLGTRERLYVGADLKGLL